MRKPKLLGLILLVLVIFPLPVSSWGPVVKISTHPDNVNGNDYCPQIVVDGSGNSYVVWNGNDGNDYETYWVKIDASGVPGTVQKISTHPDNVNRDDLHSQIEVDTSGNSYVVWDGNDGNDREIYWVKIDASGVPGTIQKISTHPDNIDRDDFHPQIVVDTSGNSYVTWIGYDGNDNEIYWISITGGVPGTIQKISTHPDNVNGNDQDPQIVADGSGNSYVVWDGNDGNDNEVYWVKIDASGTPGTVQKVSTHPDNANENNYRAQITIDASGNSYLTWDGKDGNDHEVYWVKLDASGVPGVVQKVSTHPDNANGNDYCPHIVLDGSGNSNVAWHGEDGSDFEIYWVDIDPTGVLGTVQKISTHPDNVNGNDVHSQIGIDSSGTFYVTWDGEDGNDSEIYWVSITSGISGAVEKVSTHPDNTTGYDWHPQLCVDASGNSYITWYGHDGTDYEIYWVSGLQEKTTTFGSLAGLFSTNTFLVAGDQAYSTDVLGSAKIAHALGQAGTANPEGRTETILTPLEHDTGNLIPVGGPAINPIADEFDNYFGITYNHTEGVSFEISADGYSIFLDISQYPHEDICIVYLAERNGRNILLVWGYGWQGTYAGSVLIGDQATWQAYGDAHMVMVRWIDSNADGLVQAHEIIVEQYKD